MSALLHRHTHGLLSIEQNEKSDSSHAVKSIHLKSKTFAICHLENADINKEKIVREIIICVNFFAVPISN